MKYLDALRQSGKDAKKSILPDGENKMQPGTRPGQRGNNLNPKDPESLISSPNQPAKGAKGQQKLHTITRVSNGETETKQVTQEEWRKGTLRADGWTRPEGDTDENAPAPTA